MQVGPSKTRSGKGMNTIMAWAASARRDFVDALGMFQSDEPIGIISHNDADGLASATIITRSLEGIGRPSWVRVLGRGENPWAGGAPRLSCGPRAPAG